MKSKIKETIKSLSLEQTNVKAQRKQSFTGTRTTKYPESDVSSNRYKLRHLFHLYAILRETPVPIYKKTSIDANTLKRYEESYEL